MMRRRRIRAAERPARRQANPPSPTNNELMKVNSLFFSFFDRKITSGHSVPARYCLSLYLFARLPALRDGAFSFSAAEGLDRRTGIGGACRGEAETEKRICGVLLRTTRFLPTKIKYHKNLDMSSIK